MNVRSGLCWVCCVLWLASSVSYGGDGTSAGYRQTDRRKSLSRDVSFRSPQIVEAAIGQTTVDLRVSESRHPLNGVTLRHRSFNDGIVGPTIEVMPGGTLEVRLRNELDAEPDSQHGINSPHGFNTTNLHTHGLHVSPRSPADNVFLEIAPGTGFDYRFILPHDHPAGTFWYHAHKHGSTALQLASGMSGALIVRGGLDDVPEIRDATERVMVLQQFVISPTASGDEVSIEPAAVYGDGGEIVEAINGVVTPTIVMRPGEVQRWRLIHAGTTEAMFLDAEGVTFYEIAVDGLATGRCEEKNSIQLYPGYRSDVLVKAPATAGRRLVFSMIRNADLAIRQKTTERRNLLRIVVEGEPRPMSLPSGESLQAVAAFQDRDVPQDSEIVHRRTLRFSQNDRNEFLIDGTPFDPDNPAHSLELGAAEEWTLVSESGTHPFHLHVNPFAVAPTVAGGPWVWRDTVAVTRRSPVTIRLRFRQYSGRSVLHCHNLVHEDRGMMQAIDYVDGPLISTSRPEGMPGPGGSSDGTPGDEKSRVDLGASPSAPVWSAEDPRGARVTAESFRGEWLMVVLHRGMDCLHCAQQLATLREQHDRFVGAGVRIVAISPFLPEGADAAQELSEYPFPILVDRQLKAFGALDCLDRQQRPLHGIFLIDPNNRLVLQRKTEVAVEDPWALISASKALISQGD